MIEALEQLKEAFAYAQFADPDIRAKANTLVDSLNAELTEESYEAGTGVEEATSELKEALDNTDQEREEKVGKTSSDEDDDEFAGFGDEDDEEVGG